MDTHKKPEMSLSQIGSKFKVLKVTGEKGMQMPSHFSTKEAVIVVLQGEAILNLMDKKIHLKPHESAIIPAGEPHTLELKSTFQADVVMEIESEIQFMSPGL